jgi:hypothetical protein
VQSVGNCRKISRREHYTIIYETPPTSLSISLTLPAMAAAALGINFGAIYTLSLSKGALWKHNLTEILISLFVIPFESKLKAIDEYS